MRQELEELLKQRILYQNKFLLLTAADGIACVLILIGVSRFFTKKSDFTYHGAAGYPGRGRKTDSEQ